MAFQPVRFKVRQTGWERERSLVAFLAAALPSVLIRINAAIMRLPQGRLRRELIDYWVRELMAGSFDRRDYRVVANFTTDDFRGTSAPEIAVLVGQKAGQELDRSTFVHFLKEWRSAWGDTVVTPQEVLDLGDRLLVFSLVSSRGAESGAEIVHRNEAQLYEFVGGRARLWRQFWSWDEALEAVGLSE